MSKNFTLKSKSRKSNFQKVLIFLLTLLINGSAYGQFTTINEPFKNSTYDNTKLTIFGDASLTAPSIDPSGSGWLRLTPDQGSKVGYVVMNQSFPSKLGVEFEFEFKVYGTSGADGFSVFLFDAATPTFSIGAPGGALGYSRRNAESGVSGGYLGVGIDEFGNFGASTESKPGGYNATGVPDAISVRGPGNGTTGYNYITGTGPQLGGTALAGTSIDYTTPTTARPADATYYRKAKVLIEPDATYTNYYVSVFLQTSVGGSYTTIINHVSIGTVPPANLKLGFAASTGGSTSIHEVRNVIVRTPANPDIAKTALTQLYNGETITYTITANNSSLVALNSGAITDTIPSGITVSNIVVNTTGGATASLTSGTTNPQVNINITNFPASSSVTATITGTVNVPGTVLSVKNTAYLKNLPASYTDPDPLNNISSIITNIKHIDLEVTSVNYPTTPATLIACNDYVATVAVRNNGDDLPVPPGYRVAVVLPAGTTYSATGSTPGGVYNAGTNTVTWDLSTSALNNGATANVYVGFTVLSTATTPLAGINATISSLGVQIDKAPANNAKTSATKAVSVVPLIGGQVAADQSICAGSDPIAFTQTTAASGGTGSYSYQWQSSTNGGTTWNNIGGATLATYDAPVISTTTQYRRVVTSGTNGCWTAYSNTVTVTVTPAVVAGSISVAQTICSGSAPATLTGAAPSGGNGTFAYQWQSSPNNSTWTDISGANGSTYSPPAITTNTYYRRGVSSGTCGYSYSSSVLITVYSMPVANAGGDICRNNNGSGNGSFQMGATALNAGETGLWEYVSGDPVTITNASQNNATISSIATNTTTLLKWTVTNVCGSSIDYAVVSRGDIPTTPVISSVTPICAGATRTFTTTNQVGVDFVWSIGGTGASSVTIISGQNTNSLTVNIAPNATNNFTIRVTANTACGSRTSISNTITVNPLPTANAGTDQNKCSGSFTMAANNAGVGYTQSWSVGSQDATVTAVNFSSTTSPTATVTLTGVGKATLIWTVTNTLTGCSNTDDVDLTLGTSTPTGIAGNRCGTGTVALSASGAVAGEVYRWYNAGGTLVQTNASPNFTTPSITGTTTYNVAIFNSTGNCESARIPVVATVNPLPTVFNVTGGGISCSGSGVTVGLSGSETGVNYQLQIGGVNSGSPLAGTGAALTFNNLTTAGTYTVIASNASTACTQNMTGSVVITTGAAPSQPGAFTTSTTSVCQGANNIVYTVPNVAGVTYIWSYSGTGATISGTGNSVTVSYSASATSGDLSVTASNACGTSTARTVIVTVGSTPTQPGAFTASSSTVCQGQNSVTYTVPNFAGLTYAWTYSGTGASPLTGTGNSITLNFANTATSGTLSVTASNSCGTSPAQTVAINVTPLPAQPAAFTSSSVNVCQGQSNVIYTVPDDPTVNYIWNYGGTGATITNTRGSASINFDATATSGTLSVTATNGCGLSTSRTISIIVNPLPTVFNVTGGGAYCSGGAGVSVWLSGSQTGVSYQLKDASNATIGAAVAGTGAAISFGNVTTGGTFTVLATNTTTTCNQVMNGSATIIANPLPTVNAGSSQIHCFPDFQFIMAATLNAGETGVWTKVSSSDGNLNAITIQGAGTSPTNQIDIATGVTAVVRWTVTNTVTGCKNSADITLTHYPTALTIAAPTTPSSTSSCGPTASNIVLTSAAPSGAAGPYNYQWQSKVGAGAWGNIASATSNTYTIPAGLAQTTVYRVIVVSNAGNGCTGTSASITITIDPASIGGSVSSNATVCTGTNSGTLTLNGQTGNVIRWESSTNGGTSWNPIANTTTSLSYSNLSVTTQYRAVVQSGVCASANSTAATITVNPNATIALTSAAGSNSQNVCVNNAVTTIVYTIGNGATGASITAGALPAGVTGVFSGSTFTISGTPTVSGTFNYTVTTSGGCSSANLSGSLVINANPTVVVTDPAAVCSPSTVNITVAAITAGSTAGLTYTYFTDATATATLANPNAIAVSGTYYIKGTTASGCFDIKPVQVIINTTPSVAATPLTQELACNGNNISTISISNPNAVAGTTFSWTRNKTVEVTGIAASGNSNTISGLLTNTTNAVQTVDFTVTASANGCNSSTTTVSVTVYPTMILTMTTADVACAGGSTGQINLTVSGGKPPYQFTINDGANYFPAVPTNTTFYSFSNLVKGNYQVIVRDANGCVAFPCQP